MTTLLEAAMAYLPSLSFNPSSILSWRAAFLLLLALLNAKNLPLGWHVRIFYHFARNIRRPPSVKQTISQASESSIHPIFRPVSIYSRSPLLETDYNLHKSNSTYFSDLDISRTALVTNLLSAGVRSGNAALEAEGHRGANNVILGSVHASYHKEIKPYELYEVRSRVLGWDQKWLVILSTFVRPGKKETILASALSKYVVKKARFTVPPERCLESAGWFEGIDRSEPEKQEAGKKLRGILKMPRTTLNDSTEPLCAESGILINRPHEEELQAVDVAKLEARAEEMSAKVDDKWAEGLKGSVASVEAVANVVQSERPAPARKGSTQQWTWEMIEKERLRGLEIAIAWMVLDGALAEESARVQS
jgi:hypothetical protein